MKIQNYVWPNELFWTPAMSRNRVLPESEKISLYPFLVPILPKITEAWLLLLSLFLPPMKASLIDMV